jgi:hypothetical protein
VPGVPPSSCPGVGLRRTCERVRPGVPVLCPGRTPAGRAVCGLRGAVAAGSWLFPRRTAARRRVLAGHGAGFLTTVS